MIKLMKKIRVRLRRIVREVHKRPKVYGVGLLCIGIIGAYTISYMNRQLTVNPKTCEPLLELIAQAESKGNYNAYFGNATNTEVQFTKMSVTDVINWQDEFIAKGSPSSAVGRYQIINTTLKGLVRQLNIDVDQPFDEVMQDEFAMTLLEKRGVTDYVNKRISKEQFAAELAKEWAALPRVLGDTPDRSYYADDGLNNALVTSDEVLKAIEVIEPK